MGVFLDIPLGENIFLKPELNYFLANKSTGYLEVAPLLKFQLYNSGLNFLAGPQLKFIMSDVAENYKKTGFEMAGGLGYTFRRNWFVEAKYAYELTNRFKDIIVPTGNSAIHLETFSVGLGYKFKI